MTAAQYRAAADRLRVEARLWVGRRGSSDDIRSMRRLANIYRARARRIDAKVPPVVAASIEVRNDVARSLQQIDRAEAVIRSATAVTRWIEQSMATGSRVGP